MVACRSPSPLPSPPLSPRPAGESDSGALLSPREYVLREAAATASRYRNFLHLTSPRKHSLEDPKDKDDGECDFHPCRRDVSPSRRGLILNHSKAQELLGHTRRNHPGPEGGTTGGDTKRERMGNVASVNAVAAALMQSISNERHYIAASRESMGCICGDSGVAIGPMVQHQPVLPEIGQGTPEASGDFRSVHDNTEYADASPETSGTINPTFQAVRQMLPKLQNLTLPVPTEAAPMEEETSPSVPLSPLQLIRMQMRQRDNDSKAQELPSPNSSLEEPNSEDPLHQSSLNSGTPQGGYQLSSPLLSVASLGGLGGYDLELGDWLRNPPYLEEENMDVPVPCEPGSPESSSSVCTSSSGRIELGTLSLNTSGSTEGSPPYSLPSFENESILAIANLRQNAFSRNPTPLPESDHGASIDRQYPEVDPPMLNFPSSLSAAGTAEPGLHSLQPQAAHKQSSSGVSITRELAETWRRRVYNLVLHPGAGVARSSSSSVEPSEDILDPAEESVPLVELPVELSLDESQIISSFIQFKSAGTLQAVGSSPWAPSSISHASVNDFSPSRKSSPLQPQPLRSPQNATLPPLPEAPDSPEKSESLDSDSEAIVLGFVEAFCLSAWADEAAAACPPSNKQESGASPTTTRHDGSPRSRNGSSVSCISIVHRCRTVLQGWRAAASAQLRRESMLVTGFQSERERQSMVQVFRGWCRHLKASQGRLAAAGEHCVTRSMRCGFRTWALLAAEASLTDALASATVQAAVNRGLLRTVVSHWQELPLLVAAERVREHCLIRQAIRGFQEGSARAGQNLQVATCHRASALQVSAFRQWAVGFMAHQRHKMALEQRACALMHRRQASLLMRSFGQWCCHAGHVHAIQRQAVRIVHNAVLRSSLRQWQEGQWLSVLDSRARRFRATALQRASYLGWVHFWAQQMACRVMAAQCRMSAAARCLRRWREHSVGSNLRNTRAESAAVFHRLTAVWLQFKFGVVESTIQRYDIEQFAYRRRMVHLRMAWSELQEGVTASRASREAHDLAQQHSSRVAIRRVFGHWVTYVWWQHAKALASMTCRAKRLHRSLHQWYDSVQQERQSQLKHAQSQHQLRQACLAAWRRQAVLSSGLAILTIQRLVAMGSQALRAWATAAQQQSQQSSLLLKDLLSAWADWAAKETLLTDRLLLFLTATYQKVMCKTFHAWKNSRRIRHNQMKAAVLAANRMGRRGTQRRVFDRWRFHAIVLPQTCHEAISTALSSSISIVQSLGICRGGWFSSTSCGRLCSDVLKSWSFLAHEANALRSEVAGLASARSKRLLHDCFQSWWRFLLHNVGMLYGQHQLKASMQEELLTSVWKNSSAREFYHLGCLGKCLDLWRAAMSDSVTAMLFRRMRLSSSILLAWQSAAQQNRSLRSSQAQLTDIQFRIATHHELENPLPLKDLSAEGDGSQPHVERRQYGGNNLRVKAMEILGRRKPTKSPERAVPVLVQLNANGGELDMPLPTHITMPAAGARASYDSDAGDVSFDLNMRRPAATERRADYVRSHPLQSSITLSPGNASSPVSGSSLSLWNKFSSVASSDTRPVYNWGEGQMGPREDGSLMHWSPIFDVDESSEWSQLNISLLYLDDGASRY